MTPFLSSHKKALSTVPQCVFCKHREQANYNGETYCGNCFETGYKLATDLLNMSNHISKHSVSYPKAKR